MVQKKGREISLIRVPAGASRRGAAQVVDVAGILEVPGGDGVVHGVRETVADLVAWLPWSIASQSVDGVRPEVFKAATSFGCGRDAHFPTS
jgi:hypothetical protein